MRVNHLTEGVVHAAIERQGQTAHAVQHVRLHVQARAERRTAGTRSHAALHIDLRDRRTHIRHVHPEHRLALLVVKRHFVHRHVDTRVVCAAYPEIGVPHSQTVVTGHLQTGCGGQQVRQVLPRVVTVQFFRLDDSRGESGLLHPHRTHFDIL